MDEPTLGLDIVIAKEIRRLVQELAREKKKGILLTTHYIREAEELCDYIYVLDKGKIIAQGTREELKELFMYKPQLLIQVKPSDDQEYLALLKEEGEKTADEQVLNLLMEHQIQVEGLSVQEPELEEVLMKIISQPDRRSQ